MIRYGTNPIAWSNDDDQTLGSDISLETCLEEAARIGFAGIEKGHKFPADAEAMKATLEAHGLALVSGWYSLALLSRSVEAERLAIQPHLDLLSALGCGVCIVCETSNAIHGDDVYALNHLLAEDVTLWSDGGGKAVAARSPVIGKDVVSQIFLRSARIRKKAYGELVEMNGELAILVRQEAQIIGVICLAGNNEQITDIWAVWNPDKLQHLSRGAC